VFSLAMTPRKPHFARAVPHRGSAATGVWQAVDSEIFSELLMPADIRVPSTPSKSRQRRNEQAWRRPLVRVDSVGPETDFKPLQPSAGNGSIEPRRGWIHPMRVQRVHLVVVVLDVEGAPRIVWRCPWGVSPCSPFLNRVASTRTPRPPK
jgi:hypothetical protein